MVEISVLKDYLALSDMWRKELLTHYSSASKLSINEARVLVYLWKNRGGYSSRMSHLLKIKRPTLSSIVLKFRSLGVIEAVESYDSGNKVYKMTDMPLAKAFLASAFNLCICDNIKKGAKADEIFN